ncbi:hypothetical protein SEA_PARADIDDLES_70 [Streptomyces phage Paradiddles]|jgi:hypothetical protein|uniref:Uncharacterized protein n=3 Tax=Samistivirus TaxID=2560220 RepID=A0A514U1W8_9CAUD|nr:hypothetical protein FDI36_gp184 [Streptomyces phage NootNoot]YP_009611066.1 hypothetical protein FDI37_gp179 [Streptomyces phage Paradiddles]YP_010103965.1 hypothetical protein KNU71_gp191 [Streptomyces phage Braelyn]UGL63072.1 hypothetical protein SEA_BARTHOLOMUNE_72 [Streptomyces phage Bartholomune]UOW93505.1 hypothetical protein SEA_SQUILLIUM_73 [Streptomyces phage Squillium]WNM72952.1 hypothetical protein SEA_PERSIMMON_70 [Streptomyces phage Persimmon]WNM73337.1 hypothetical protein S
MTVVKGNITYTHNLGNFRSVKVDVGIEDTVREGESVDQAFERVFNKLEDQLGTRVAKAVDELG